MELDGNVVRVTRPNTKVCELHEFATAPEARARMLFVQEQLEWFGTPFLDCCDMKGPNGGVDCAMLMVRAAVDTGLIAPFDPRPYAPRWMLKREAKELLMETVLSLGAVEVEAPRFGDMSLFQFGWCLSHAATLMNNDQYFHAAGFEGICLSAPRNDAILMYMPIAGRKLPRPVKHFDIWGKRGNP